MAWVVSFLCTKEESCCQWQYSFLSTNCTTVCVSQTEPAQRWALPISPGPRPSPVSLAWVNGTASIGSPPNLIIYLFFIPSPFSFLSRSLLLSLPLSVCLSPLNSVSQSFFILSTKYFLNCPFLFIPYISCLGSDSHYTKSPTYIWVLLQEHVS